MDLDIRPGEVHGLVGANGAGKSTLIRLLAGVDLPDDGIVLIDGRPTAIPNPQRATALGLSFIHQELALVPHCSAIENMTLGLPKPTRAGLIDWPKVHAEVADVVERLGIDFPLNTPISALSVAEQWMLSIGRALIRRARLIAMDEPTASLSSEESERLFKVIRDLAADGIAILYVSHRLDEILHLCDVVTVFQDGERVLFLERADLTRSALVRGIVGGELAEADAGFRPPRSRRRRARGRPPAAPGPRSRTSRSAYVPARCWALAGLVGAGAPSSRT